MEEHMKNCIVLLIVVFVMCSCVNVKFVGKDGTKVEYTRFLTNVDKISGKVGDSNVSVGGSVVNVEALTELLQAIPK
jgi:hypothetical protein